MLKYQVSKPNLDPSTSWNSYCCLICSYSEIILSKYNNRLTALMTVFTVFHHTFCSHLIFYFPPHDYGMFSDFFTTTLWCFLPKRYTFYLECLVLIIFFLSLLLAICGIKSMKALSPYLSQKINWSWEQLPESKFSMKLVFQNCLYSQTICQFLLNLLKLLGQSWPFMETQGKTMLRSFNLKKKNWNKNFHGFLNNKKKSTKIEQYLGKVSFPIWLVFPSLLEMEVYLHISN